MFLKVIHMKFLRTFIDWATDQTWWCDPCQRKEDHFEVSLILLTRCSYHSPCQRRILTPADLARDMMKSDSASIIIPELELELQEGTLGSKYTTVVSDS